MNATHFDPEKVRTARREASIRQGQILSQSDVAKAVGCQWQTISRAELGKDVSYELLCSLARYYDVPITAWLFPRPWTRKISKSAEATA